MKETYLKHYWLLFMEFIEAFKELTHHNIPLPLLINFYQFIDEDTKKEMHNEAFSQHLKQKSLVIEQIQPYFENLLTPIRVPFKKKPLGLTLLNYDYLRFPPEILKEHFNANESVILSRNKPRISAHYGIPIHGLADYKNNNYQLGERLIKSAQNIFVKHRKHILFSNISFQKKFIDQIPMMINYINTVENYLSKVSISCIIVGTTEEIISRILAIIAASKGIPSICMQHGAVMGEEAFMPAFTTKLAVFGEYEKQWYLGRGVAKERIEIIGHPRFDQIFNKKYMSKSQFIQQFGLDPKKIQILVTTQPTNVEDWDWAKLFQELSNNPKFEIIIKPHPWEIAKKQYSIYEQLCLKNRSIKLILSRNILYDLISNVNLVVVLSSTVGLEAMLFDKPVFVMERNKYYVQMGKFANDNIKSLVALINKNFQDHSLQMELEQQRKQFIANSYPQKLSGPKLVKLIHKLTN